MLKEYTLLNLQEAKNKLETIIESLEQSTDYELESFAVDIQHLYAHVNAAWNGRNFDIDSDELTAEIFANYIAFPKDIIL